MIERKYKICRMRKNCILAVEPNQNSIDGMHDVLFGGKTYTLKRASELISRANRSDNLFLTGVPTGDLLFEDDINALLVKIGGSANCDKSFLGMLRTAVSLYKESKEDGFDRYLSMRTGKVIYFGYQMTSAPNYGLLKKDIEKGCRNDY